MELTAQTRLADIIKNYPFVQAGFTGSDNKLFFTDISLDHAMEDGFTIADLSEHSGISVSKLLSTVGAKIAYETAVPDDYEPIATQDDAPVIVVSTASLVNGDLPQAEQAAKPSESAPAVRPTSKDLTFTEDLPSWWVEGDGDPDDIRDLPLWWVDAISFPVIDVRGARNNFFLSLRKRAEAVEVGSGLTVVQSFEPVPLYEVMQGLGFERVTRKTTSGEYRVYFYRARKGDDDKNIVFRPTALLNFPMIDHDLADLAVEFWDLTWNDNRRHLPQEMRLLLSMTHALGAGRMRQASRELIKAYAQGCESAAIDDVLELVAWNSGVGTFASEIGPSTFFRIYRTIKEQEAKGVSRAQIVDMLMERFGEGNPDVGV